MDKRLEKIIVALIIEKSFEGYLLANFDLDILKDPIGPIDTACLGYSNGRFFIRFAEKFFESLTEPQRIGILRHEIGHFIHKHLSRRGGRDPMIWNLACDAAINQFLDDLPEGGMKPLEGMEEKQNAEYYYEELQKRAKKITIKIYGQDGQGCKCKSEGKDKCDCGGRVTCTLIDNLEEAASETQAAEAQAQAETMVRDVVAQRLAAGDDSSKMRGLYGGALEELIKELTKKPMINWRTALVRFVSSFTLHDTSRTLKKPDRRQISPWGRKKERLPKLIVAIDTSGSVTERLLSKFFGQIKILGMMLSEVRMIECDANVTVDVVYRPGLEKKVQLGYAKGRGGTDYDPVVALVNKKYRDYDGLVYLTDGYCPVPTIKSKVPVLWVIQGADNFKGKPAVFVPKEE